ncbi:GntR family transcriptional regulator [Thalassospira alkalitolerans]|uniref:GntR family transcriptional regulator n=1 Tax=Thalassospira alkalitolerans TaxID=1293890 RepID=UPI003AA82244
MAKRDTSKHGNDIGPSLTDVAYDAIQNMIVTGELEAHQLISESELGRTLDCGRTPIREALQRLKFEGFVDVMPRRGILVTAADVTGQLDLLEMRRPLEALTVRLAARRATSQQRARMRELASEIEAAVAQGDISLYLKINKEIHTILTQSVKNRFLHNQMSVVHNLSRRFWYSFISSTDSFSLAAVHHAETLRAVANKDEDLAEKHNRDLLNLLESVTRAKIENRD